MPLRVQCPNGCVMRVPSNRAGMSARCPGCKAVVVIPFPPSDYEPTEILEAVPASSAIAAKKQDASTADTPDPPKPVSEKPEKPEVKDSQKAEATRERKKESEPKAAKLDTVKPKVEESSIEKVEPKETPKPVSSEKPKPKPKKESEPSKNAPTTRQPAPTSEKRRKQKRKRKIATESAQQKSLPKLDLAASSNQSEKVQPRDKKPKVEPPKPVAQPVGKQPNKASEVSTTSPLDGVFSAFAADVPETVKSKPKKQPKTNANKNVEKESTEPISVPTFDTAKPVSELPTIDPANRRDDPSPVSTSSISKVEPEAFQFDDRLPLGERFEPENQTSNGVSAIEIRTRRANADRVTLTRFFAAMLVFVGLVNFAPAIYCWYTWSQVDIDFLLPRWIYLQIFIAVLHLVYAVLLLQVPDWSTLRSIAIVMLAFAFVFGLFSMGLLTTGGNGLLAQFLQVPDSLGRQACIWCVAMLCLATLASYLAGRESNNWQRTERLLAEILANKEAT